MAHSRSSPEVSFSRQELRDLGIALIALSVAFAIFFAGGGARALSGILDRGVVIPVLVSLLTAGLGFLLHEVAHKIIAVRFGQLAEFRADYGMLFLAVMSSLAGFIFAAPGAVHHQGRVTSRQHGLIALAGPVTNAILTVIFVPIYLVGLTLDSSLITLIGSRGLMINLLLVAFNMLPFGSLDGRTVYQWNPIVFAVVFIPALLLTIGAFLTGFGF